MSNGGLITILVILVLLSAFFSMTETTFSSVSEAKIKTLVENRKNGSKKALYCITHFDQTLTTLLVGNNIVNTAISVLSVTLVASFVRNEDYVSLIATIGATIILLIFGEILPKTIAKKYNEHLALILGPITVVLSIILYPIVIIFRGLQKLITGSKKDESHVDENTLETILDTMEDEGTIETDEVKLIKNVFDLNDQTVENIMTPRIDMVAINVDSTIEEVKKIFSENNYSRVPVFKEDKDHIVGILYEREFYSALINNKDLSIEKLMKAPKYVNKAMTVDTLIHELQSSKVHMAIVLGEYGDTLGIVTMEDALEELVGEIYDEHDEVSNKPLIIKNEDGSYLVDGEVTVDDLFDYLQIGDAPEDETGKVSSWVFESSEELPQVGQTVTYIARYTSVNEEGDYEDYAKCLTFCVAKVIERRIETIKLTITDATEEQIESKEEEEDSD